MASQLIAHVAAWYIPTGQPLVNDMDGLTIDGAYRLEAQRMHAELERRARGQPLCVEIDIRPVKNKRTLDQNRLMWALLNRLALALSGGTPGGVTAEQCYLDLLAEFGAEVETWRVPVKALPALRNTYRVVQMVELLDNGYGLKVWLCHNHHNEPHLGVHFDPAARRVLEQAAQFAFDELHGPGSFAEVFGEEI